MRLIPFVLLIVLAFAPLLYGQYTYVDLHPEGYDRSKALGIHNGDIVGSGMVTGGSIDHAILWQGLAHTIVDLHPIWATSGSVANATYNGKQVGLGISGDARAFLWSGTVGSLVDLTPILGYNGAELVDNWEDTQVGHGNPSGTLHAMLWQGTAASFVDLHPTGSTISYAKAVWGNQQVGVANQSGALLWSGTAESVVDLTPADFTYAEATDVYDGQQVGYGYGPSTGNNDHALLWTGNPESVVDLNSIAFRRTRIVANSNGKQLGWGDWWDGSKHFLLWSGTAQNFIYLDSFLPGGVAGSITVTDIDADGTIVGYNSSDNHAFMLIPNSDPYCTGPIEGDFNNDCMLNIFDFVIFAANWMACNLEPYSNCY